MKKDNKKNTWKDELWNGIGELILAFAATGIGFGKRKKENKEDNS